MKNKDRDMFYQNYNASGFNMPNAMPNAQMMPNGYNVSSQMQAYGPNVIPEQVNNYGYASYDNNYEQRITRLEKQIRTLDTRVQKLEGVTSDAITDNIYMI